MGLNNNNNTTTTTTTTTTAMIGIKIKNEMNNEIRKLSIDKDITFILFKQNILNIFGLNNVNSLKFTYKDEDNDDIILSNDGEWKIATLNASNILKISFTFSNEKEHKEIEKVEKVEIEKVEIEKVEIEKVEKVEIEKVEKAEKVEIEKVEKETIPPLPLPTLPQTTTTTTTSNDHHHQHHHHWRNNNKNFHQNQNQNQNPNRFFFKRGPEGKELKHRIQLARKTNNIEQLLDIFTELGFDDREFNRKLLIENNNKIRKCFAQLMTNANTTVIPNTNPNENTNENVTPTENGNWNHGNWKKHHHSNQHPFFKKGFEQKVLKDRIKLAKKTNNVETLLDILNEFGFNDREGNRKLLQQNNNKIRKCVKILLSNNPDVVVKQPSWNYDPIVNYNINFKNYA